MKKVFKAILVGIIAFALCVAVHTGRVINKYADIQISVNPEIQESLNQNWWLSGENTTNTSDVSDSSKKYIIPAHSDNDPFTIINDNVPYFSEDDLMTEPYEFYSELDSFGRCGTTLACVCKETMPTEKRGEIGMIKPTGWHTVKYDCVDGKYLYNRCHLIGFQLTAENANEKNLITGTRYFNVEGMLPFENLVADYVKETGNHVMYRVTPAFDGNDLVAKGVFMEAYSVEDNGAGVCYNVFVFNFQPGVEINYTTGDSNLV